jgi:hypothetical protein
MANVIKSIKVKEFTTQEVRKDKEVTTQKVRILNDWQVDVNLLSYQSHLNLEGVISP